MATRPEPAFDSGLDAAAARSIVDYLDAHFGVDALWIFGSVASGMATATSDIDLAMLAHRRCLPLELIDARGDLAAQLGRPVDLVDLDRASPILVMQVLRHGHLLLDRDPARRHRLAAAAPGRYEDLMIVRRPVERALLDRLRRGRS